MPLQAGSSGRQRLRVILRSMFVSVARSSLQDVGGFHNSEESTGSLAIKSYVVDLFVNQAFG